MNITLKPSLRAAFRLSADYGSFEALFEEVLAGNVQAFSDVIKAGSGSTTALTDYIDSEGDLPLKVRLDLLIKPVTDFIVALHGPEAESPIDGDMPRNDKITHNEFHNRLYMVATGWLGWSPDEAWEATPDEILVAYEGLTEKLRAIHGGKETEEIDLTKMDASERRAQLHALSKLGGPVCP